MKAYKLIWLADRYHLRQYGRTITGDRYFAMQHGLVPSDAKNIVEGEAPRHVSMTDGLPTGISHDRQGYTYSYSKQVESDLFFDNFDDGHGLFLDSPEKMAATRDFYHLFNR